MEPGVELDALIARMIQDVCVAQPGSQGVAGLAGRRRESASTRSQTISRCGR